MIYIFFRARDKTAGDRVEKGMEFSDVSTPAREAKTAIFDGPITIMRYDSSTYSTLNPADKWKSYRSTRTLIAASEYSQGSNSSSSQSC